MVAGKELSELAEESILEKMTYISHQSYLFKGTVRENLLMGKKTASDEQMWEALRKVNLETFLRGENGLETKLLERASNFSGGQRQRLALARALLHDSEVYVFDEATSNIDAESENDIMEAIYQLAKDKTVILISHRLANVTGADKIYVLEAGNVVETGTHEELRKLGKLYEKLWNTQQSLENYGKAGVGA